MFTEFQKKVIYTAAIVIIGELLGEVIAMGMFHMGMFN